MKRAKLKTAWLRARCSQAELKLVTAAAKNAQLSMGEYIRGMCVLLATWQMKDPDSRRPGQQVFFDLMFQMESETNKQAAR